ncbi:MAG: hypothetical protein EBU31_00150 [Proteobacteria bacterium]|jgi:hypothetical protein|nr:hypothetical protein [Pseudomonadota bacterium]
MRRINFERWDDRTHKWLFILSFDLDQIDELQLEQTTDRLLRMCAHSSKTARLITPGEDMGQLYWTETTSWQEPVKVDDHLAAIDWMEG